MQPEGLVSREEKGVIPKIGDRVRHDKLGLGIVLRVYEGVPWSPPHPCCPSCKCEAHAPRPMKGWLVIRWVAWGDMGVTNMKDDGASHAPRLETIEYPEVSPEGPLVEIVNG